MGHEGLWGRMLVAAGFGDRTCCWQLASASPPHALAAPTRCLRAQAGGQHRASRHPQVPEHCQAGTLLALPALLCHSSLVLPGLLKSLLAGSLGLGSGCGAGIWGALNTPACGPVPHAGL